jgi:hypothetical protein
VNTEERQLAEMLHRVTPEPPRGVTVEDVASRLASQAGQGQAGRGHAGYREPRPRRGPRLTGRRGWAPVLAAASVFVVAGASAGIATVVTSHHGPASPAGGGTPTSSASVSSAPSSATPSSPSSPPASAGLPLRIAGGIWGAALINRQSFTQDSLVGGAGSLYAAAAGSLDRIDPATGNIVRTTPYNPPVPNRPIVMGNTVWVVWSYSGGNAVLHGYDARTLAQVASVPVFAIGPVSSAAQGVLTGGPDGHLYLAAGDTVAVVDPAAGHVIRRIYLVAGPASAVAVSPDVSRLYVGIVPSTSPGSFRLLTYDLATAVLATSSKMAAGGAGNLVATSGGVWGTTGTGMSERVWFAPGGDLASSFRVGQGAGGGLDSVPALSGGAVWIGGSQQLVCANPATGKVLASTAVPTDNNIVEYFSSVTVLSSGRTYALYQDQAAHLSGVATLTPPAAC